MIIGLPKTKRAAIASMSGISNWTMPNSLTIKRILDPGTEKTGQNGQITGGITSLNPEFS
jgi:hypothetical protein